MAKYDLKLKTTDAGTEKARTLTLSNVNPNASSTVLKQFTHKLNDLTLNTYVETDYVVTTNLDTETPPIDTRTETTFSFDNGIAVPQSTGTMPSFYTTNSDGNISFAIEGVQNVLVGIGYESNKINMNMYVYQTRPAAGTQATIIVRIEGTETYQPFEQSYEFTF